LTQGEIEDLLRAWEVPHPDLDKATQLVSRAQPEEEPSKPHFLVVISDRWSSTPGPVTLAQVVANLPIIANTYNNYLNSGMHPGAPESHRPAQIMRTFGMAFARQGTRALSLHITNNLTDPFLRGFVNLLHDVTRPANPNLPVEWHFLTNGFAGLTVDVRGMGDRSRGVFKFILDTDAANGTDLAKRIYMVVLCEARVVDGVRVCSLHHPLPTPGFRGYHNKYVHKNALGQLIDRNFIRVQFDQQNAQLVLAGQPPVPIPARTPQEIRLDNHLDAWADEYDWRANHLDAAGSGRVQERNVNRNASWNWFNPE
jgi:hypothetical protein